MKKNLQTIFSAKNSADKSHKIITILGVKIKFKRHKKNYALNSGERQTATEIKNIRIDHVNRYQKAVEMINKYTSGKNLRGIDMFCGNGYGSKFIVQNIDTTLDSIDGSNEAIECAKKYYQDSKITFENKLFPFVMNEKFYDYAVSLESIEHVKNDKLFLTKLKKALKPGGVLIISTPNQEKQNLKLNPNKFHFRHYTNEEFINLARKKGFELLEKYGQDTYIFNEEGVMCGVLDTKKMSLIKDYNGQFTIYVLRKV